MARGARAGLGSHRSPPGGLGRLCQGVAVAVPAAFFQVVRQACVPGGALGQFLFCAQAACSATSAPAARGGGLLGKQVVVHGPFVIVGAAGPTVQLELADVASAPLGQGKAEGLRQALGQRGQVFVNQLLLQRHGGCGDHHTRVARQRQHDGGHAVGQRLAHARTGLDDGNGTRRFQRLDGAVLVLGGLAQVGLGEGAGHLFGHQALARARAQAAARLHHLVEYRQCLPGPRCFVHGAGV